MVLLEAKFGMCMPGVFIPSFSMHYNARRVMNEDGGFIDKQQ